MPDIDWLYKQYEHLRDDVYGRMRQNMLYWDRLHEGDIDCHVPKDEPTHIPPLAKREVAKAANQLSSDAITYEVQPYDTEAQRVTGDLLKRAIDLTLEESDWVNESDVLREMDVNLAHRGMGVLKGPFCDYAKLESGRWPFFVLPLDPLHFLPDPGGRFVIEAQERYVEEILEDIRRWNEGKSEAVYSDEWLSKVKKGDQPILWLEYYSVNERMFAVGVNGKAYSVSSVQPNVYGYIPYSWAYSGWGKGKSSGKPQLRAIGRLSGMESAIEALARSYSALNIQLRYHVYGKYFAPKDSKPDMDIADTGPAGVTFLEPEHMPNVEGGVALWPAAQVNPDLFRYVAMALSDIEGIGGHPALQGQGPADESGLKAMTRIRQAAMDYGPPRKAKEAILSHMATNLAGLMSNDIVVDRAVLVIGRRSLSPDDIFTNTRVRAKLEFQDPQYDRENIEIGLRMLERGALTLQGFASDYVKSDDAGSLVARLAAERIMMAALQDPSSPLAQMLLARVMEAHGIDQAALELGKMTPSRSMGSGGKQTIRPERREQRMEEPAGGVSPVDVRRLSARVQAGMMEGGNV